MPARRDVRHVDEVPVALRHYLVTGCFAGGLDLETFLMAGRALQGDLTGLRELWRAHGAAVKRQHLGEMFAERALKLPPGDPFAVSRLGGRTTCREHPTRRRESNGR